jgi:hypothetical protein
MKAAATMPVCGRLAHLACNVGSLAPQSFPIIGNKPTLRHIFSAPLHSSATTRPLQVPMAVHRMGPSAGILRPAPRRALDFALDFAGPMVPQAASTHMRGDSGILLAVLQAVRTG